MKTETFGIIVLLAITMFSLGQIMDLKRNRVTLTNDKNKTDSLYIWQSERLLIYYLITLEQNELIESNRSSRNLKENNKKLIELQTKLN